MKSLDIKQKHVKNLKFLECGHIGHILWTTLVHVVIQLPLMKKKRSFHKYWWSSDVEKSWSLVAPTRPLLSKSQKKNYQVPLYSKNNNEILYIFFALASKRSWIKKFLYFVRKLLITIIRIIKCFYFLFQLLFSGKGKKLFKISLVFWSMGEVGILFLRFTDLLNRPD